MGLLSIRERMVHALFTGKRAGLIPYPEPPVAVLGK